MLQTLHPRSSSDGDRQPPGYSPAVLVLTAAAIPKGDLSFRTMIAEDWSHWKLVHHLYFIKYNVSESMFLVKHSCSIKHSCVSISTNRDEHSDSSAEAPS